ncbi:MAG: response regulator [Thermodesulfobacteriota bacterium]
MATILVTDDQQISRDVLSEMLRNMGHEVRTAFNGSEALRLFAQTPFDLVTTDLYMPVMDGYILAKRIKQKSPDTPVIMITGSVIEDLESRKTKHENVDLVLSKPLTFQTLEKATAGFLYSDSKG